MAEIILINSPDNSNTNSNAHTNLPDTNEQQVKEGQICHPVWQYLSWNINNEKKFESESKVLRNTNKIFIILNYLKYKRH